MPREMRERERKKHTVQQPDQHFILLSDVSSAFIDGWKSPMENCRFRRVSANIPKLTELRPTNEF